LASRLRGSPSAKLILTARSEGDLRRLAREPALHGVRI
jgi:hypothetical protein